MILTIYGGSGYIGRNISPLLEQAGITTASKSKSSSVHLPYLNPNTLFKKPIDVLYLSDWSDIKSCKDTEVLESVDRLDTLLKTNQINSIYYISSTAIYASNSDCSSKYVKMKLSNESLIQAFSEKNPDSSCHVLRVPIVAASIPKDGTLLSKIMDSNASDEVRLTGDYVFSAFFLYINDLAQTLCELIQTSSPGYTLQTIVPRYPTYVPSLLAPHFRQQGPPPKLSSSILKQASSHPSQPFFYPRLNEEDRCVYWLKS